MPTIAFPADVLARRGPSSITWGLQSSTLTHASPLSGAIRTLATPGARWRFTATWPALSPVYDGISTPGSGSISDRGSIEAFLAALNGRAGRFTFYPPESVTIQHGIRANTIYITQATVNGGSQTGSFLLCTASHPSTAWQGAFFSVNGELKRVTQSTGTDVSGNITLAFSPPLRSSPPNGAAVSFVKPLGTFMLVDDYAGLTVGPGGYADFTLDAIEAFL
jgi:hypothetical protein